MSLAASASRAGSVAVPVSRENSAWKAGQSIAPRSSRASRSAPVERRLHRRNRQAGHVGHLAIGPGPIERHDHVAEVEVDEVGAAWHEAPRRGVRGRRQTLGKPATKYYSAADDPGKGSPRPAATAPLVPPQGIPRMAVLNRYSSRITQPRSQGASQAMLLGTGLQPADLDKPQVGIASMWYEGNTCNMHLNTLAAKVREGVIAAGMVGMRFNTIGVSDGISMGTEGMSYSLPSRDIIADSLETVMHAQWYDALVAIPGCDKNMPGCLIAMGRLNRPALMVYGGTIKPGHLADGTSLDIVSAFQCYGEYVAGRIDDARRGDIVRHACPGAGACGGMYTANTMATAIEAMGMALPDSASIPAEHPDKLDECLRAGAAIRHLLELDLKPRDIMTRASLRERDGHDHGARRFDERRAAPDRHGPHRGRRSRAGRLPEGGPPRSPTSPTSSPAASSCRKTCTRSAARAA